MTAMILTGGLGLVFFLIAPGWVTKRREDLNASWETHQQAKHMAAQQWVGLEHSQLCPNPVKSFFLCSDNTQPKLT